MSDRLTNLPTIEEAERAVEAYESKGDHLWIGRSPEKTDYVFLEAAKKMIRIERENNQLRADLKRHEDSSYKAELLFAELEGSLMGLMMHPSNIPLNGCLISEESKTKLSHIGDIIKRYKNQPPFVQSLLSNNGTRP